MEKLKPIKRPNRAMTGVDPLRMADIGIKVIMDLERIKGKLSPFSARMELLSKHDQLENVFARVKEIKGLDPDDEQGEYFCYGHLIFKWLTDEREETDAELERIDEAINAKYEEAGEEAEDWLDGEPPEEIRNLEAAYDARSRQINVEIMREYGEGKMADLLLKNEKEYYRRFVRGALYILKDNQEAQKKEKNKFRNYIIARGWNDLLPDLEM